MNYNRKICYISYYEGDEKKGNAGYVKLLENDSYVEADVRVSGISDVLMGEKELVVSAGPQIIKREKLLLQKGAGLGIYCWEKGQDFAKLTFRIELAQGCFLDSGEVRKAVEENATKTWIPETMEVIEEPVLESEIGTEAQIELEAEEEKGAVDQLDTVKEEAPKDKVEKRKWDQIYSTYPHIKPFKDFREYVKLELNDMVLLSEKKYSLVENSFLLHGYYNYDHLILWKKEKKPVKYYVGVPGNFYEKEKQVALLYGFDSFEGEMEPAKEGDFGYYMTEVSI